MEKMWTCGGMFGFGMSIPLVNLLDDPSIILGSHPMPEASMTDQVGSGLLTGPLQFARPMMLDVAKWTVMMIIFGDVSAYDFAGQLHVYMDPHAFIHDCLFEERSMVAGSKASGHLGTGLGELVHVGGASSSGIG
ncbi:hypothetical protein V6N12_069933 [Hibiscus sabdariffa]|uniref:Uncharacterized protein n=1 Tax=Hibiscus sabdariffa TaxID=183260 RepID=A0ABR2FFC0_9ROSI